jgi:hypothetical protein
MAAVARKLCSPAIAWNMLDSASGDKPAITVGWAGCVVMIASSSMYQECNGVASRGLVQLSGIYGVTWGQVLQ